MKKITKNLQLSRQKTVKILTFFDQKAKENSNKSVSFLVDIGKRDVTINCKRLADLCDNHTQKLLRDTTKLLQSDIEATSLQEVRSKKKTKLPCPQQKIVALWISVLPELQAPKIWDGTRQQILKARWEETEERQNLEWWRKFFEYIRTCPFLMGDVDPAPDRQRFYADLPWVLKKANFLKIIEGKYDRRQ